jgi:hypothetical protein
MATTITVVTRVSRRVGHVTFAASARTCCKYSNGLVRAMSSNANAKPFSLRYNSVKLCCPIVPKYPARPYGGRSGGTRTPNPRFWRPVL